MSVLPAAQGWLGPVKPTELAPRTDALFETAAAHHRSRKPEAEPTTGLAPSPLLRHAAVLADPAGPHDLPVSPDVVRSAGDPRLRRR